MTCSSAPEGSLRSPAILPKSRRFRQGAPPARPPVPGHREPPDGGPAAWRPHPGTGAALLAGPAAEQRPQRSRLGPGQRPQRRGGRAGEGSTPPLTYLSSFSLARPPPGAARPSAPPHPPRPPPRAAAACAPARRTPCCATSLSRDATSPHAVPGALKVTPRGAANDRGARAERDAGRAEPPW